MGEGAAVTLEAVAPFAPCLDGCVGTGAGRSGVVWEEENLELMLVIHELLRPPLLFSELLRLRSAGRFG